MCDATSHPTFVAAVEDVVQKMILTNLPFSAYDVTRTLRDLLQSKFDLGINPAETGSSQTPTGVVPTIDHSLVRKVVHDLFLNGQMKGYDRAHSGTYWTYAPVPSAPAIASGSYTGNSVL